MPPSYFLMALGMVLYQISRHLVIDVSVNLYKPLRNKYEFQLSSEKETSVGTFL